MAQVDCPDERFDRVTRLAARILRAPVVLFSLVNGDRQVCKSAVGLAPSRVARQTPLAESLGHHVVQCGHALVVRDVRLHPTLADHPAIRDLNAAAIAGVPVRAMNGELLGTFCVIDTVPRDWTADDVAVLEDMSVSVGTQVELRREIAARERVARELGAAREQLQDYLENIPVLVQLATPDGRLFFVNRTWRQTLRYAESDVARLCAGDVISPDHRAAYLDAVRRVLAGESVPAFDTVFLDAGGQRLVMRAMVSARFEDGEAVAVRGTFEDVTLQRGNDEAQARLVQVLDATTDFVGIATMDGRAVYINRAGRALIGVGEHEDVSALRMSSVYTLAARQRVLSSGVPAALRDGTWEGESAIRRRDGREIPVSQVIVAHESAQSGVWYFSTIMRDISDQKRTEDEFRLLQSLTEAIGDAEDLHVALVIALDRLCQVTGWPYAEVWVPDESGTVLTLGPVWCQPSPPLVAYARASQKHVYARGVGLPGGVWATGRPSWVRDVGTDESLPRAQMSLAAGLKATVGVPVMADGELVAVLAFGMAELTDEQEYQLRLVSVVAAQLGGMMRRKQAEDARRASEERFRRLAMASNDGIVISRNGRFLEVNAAWSRMSGYPEGELPDIPIGEHVADEDRAEVLHRAGRNVEGTYYATIKRLDGTMFEAEITAKSIIYEGAPARIAVMRDVTAWRRVDRMKSEFVSTVSHELRTPLTSIRGAIGLLEGGITGEMAPKALDLLRMARENTDRLIRLINELLDLDKIEAGKLELRWTTLMPADIVRTTLNGIAAMADEYKVRLVERVEAHRTFAADRDRIIQVLTNLVSNAIKFSDMDSAIEIEATAAPSVVRFAVHNAGAGISAADRARLFAKFQQLDAGDNRRRGGTGLGLAISKAIVEQHGGRIGVESELNAKTTFWFELPLTRPTTVSQAITVAT